MSDERTDPIARRDEVLEVLYWLEGEGIPGAATVAGIARFLTRTPDDVHAVIATLLERGDVEPHGDSEYRLTEPGRREAGRRFAEQFAGMTGQGHGECNDPTCDCHTNPAGAAECHAARAHKRSH
ncbi:MAG: hypothetical protein ACT4QD_21710 [Acidobacteriota bacterium]